MSIHLEAKDGDIAEIVLLPGDPQRARFLAETFLEDVVCYNYLRGMLGFTGTVMGMIGAFDDIAAANQMSPAIVASGISEALLTTLFGLIVAIILQFFYNYFVSKVDKIVGDMEESSIELIDSLYEMNK